MYLYDPEEYGELEPLWPHALVSRGLVAVAALMLWVGLAFFWPELFMPPDRPPGAAAAQPQAALPWYLWPLQGLGRLLPGGVALVLALAAGAAFLLLPWLDRGLRAYFWERYLYSRLVLAGLVLVAFLSFWGWL